MAIKVEKENQVAINNYLYNIKGRINAQYLSRLPAKVNIGSDSFDRENILSNWIIKDQRGGLGYEEMDESVDADKFWWSDCVTDYEGHILLPRLATVLSKPTSTNPTIVNSDMELTTGWLGDGSRSSAQAHAGTYSWLQVPANSTKETYQDTSVYIPGQEYTFTAWVKVTDAVGTINVKIGINDGVGTTYCTPVAGTGDLAWTQLTVTRTLVINASRLRLLMWSESTTPGGSANVYYDDAACTMTALSLGSTLLAANFNGNCYWAFGVNLVKLNAGRTGFTLVGIMPASITALVPSLNSCLYIFVGDSNSYIYMSTAEAFITAVGTDGAGGGTSSAATYAFQWDNKLFKGTTAGVFTYSATPNSATPTWTAAGNITDIASQIESFYIGPDADGDDIPYCATNSTLKAYDLANTKWWDTKLKLPDHPNGGKGAVYWRDGAFISSGLDVRKYTTGSVASISEVGLNRRDGLPSEYNGEIVKFSGGDINDLFALVDASQVTGTAKSGLYAYDSQAWRCWWVPELVIETCESVWIGGVGVTVTLDTSDFQVGAASVNIAVPVGAAAGDLMAYSIISYDLSPYTAVSFWIKSTVALSLGDLALLLDDTNACASPIEVIDVPAVSANTWTRVTCNLATPASDTAILSVGLRMVVDKGAFSVKIDHVMAEAYDGTMHDIIISSASSGYAVYWDHNGFVYYIDLPRGTRNPTQLSTQNYGFEGLHITPYFDAGTSAYTKLVKALRTYAKGVSTTEMITVKYRTNRTYHDLWSGWTILDTLNSTGESGENEELFASGAGVEVNAIQLAFDFARYASYASPDLQGVAVPYMLIVDKNWSGVVRVEFDSDYLTTPRQKQANIEAAIASGTLVPFIYYGGTTKYVQIMDARGEIQTGDHFENDWMLQLVEV